MKTDTDATTSIRGLVDGVRKALHDKDVDRLMTYYPRDFLTFDLAPPLEHRGADVHRKNTQEWFATFTGPVDVEVRDLAITACDDVAFSTALHRITGNRTSGEHTDVWVRATICYRKLDGRWTVAHEHLSVPFYMDGSVKAAVDLKP
jgi:uncharacterized protein (TIGR02246 family)